MGLMMMSKDGHFTTRAQAEAVPTPEPTRTWHPVSNAALIELIEGRADELLGLERVSEQYGLSSKDRQLFGVFAYDTGNPKYTLNIGFRNSMNKTLSIGVAGGGGVICCSNLIFEGDAFKILRKHTTNVWDDLTAMLDEVLRNSVDHYHALEDDFAQLQEVPVSTDEGFGAIGYALGHKLLTTTQGTAAINEWRTPSYEDFAPRTAWSLHNAFTSGLKYGTAANAIERTAAAHAFFKSRFMPPADVMETV